MFRVIAAALLLASCAHAAAPAAGGIAGLVRDRDSGEPIALAAISVRRDGELAATTAKSGADGFYDVERLPPGRYQIAAHYAGVTVEVGGIAVAPGRVTAVDLPFELGRPERIHLELVDTAAVAIARFRPAGADPAHGRLDGTVTDTGTRERVVGAVVTVTSPALADAVQVVTDERGRFAVPDLPPGTYALSAYYAVTRRGTIEVRRTAIPISGGERVEVPLWVDLAAP